MNTCGECKYYSGGFCKIKHAEIHIWTVQYNRERRYDGWPKVNKDEGACGEFEKITSKKG